MNLRNLVILGQTFLEIFESKHFVVNDDDERRRTRFMTYGNKEPTNWLGHVQNAAPLNFDPKPSEAAFLAVFSDLPEAAGDVISGLAVE